MVQLGVEDHDIIWMFIFFKNQNLLMVSDLRDVRQRLRDGEDRNNHQDKTENKIY